MRGCCGRALKHWIKMAMVSANYSAVTQGKNPIMGGPEIL